MSGRERVRGVMPLDLLTTDRVLQRWAVSVGSGLPSETWDDTRVAKPPPLPDDIAIIVDRAILKAPRRKALIVKLWYRTPVPTGVIANRLQCPVRALTVELNAALTYLRLRMVGSGHKTLRTLILEVGPLAA